MNLPKPGEVWEREGERREVVSVAENDGINVAVFWHGTEHKLTHGEHIDDWQAWANPPPAPPPARLVRTAEGKRLRYINAG